MTIAEGYVKIIFDDNTSATFGPSKDVYSGAVNKNIKQMIVGPYSQVMLSDLYTNNWIFPYRSGMVSNKETIVGATEAEMKSELAGGMPVGLLTGQGTLRVMVVSVPHYNNIGTKEHYSNLSPMPSFAALVIILVIIVIIVVIYMHYGKNLSCNIA